MRLLHWWSLGGLLFHNNYHLYSMIYKYKRYTIVTTHCNILSDISAYWAKLWDSKPSHSMAMDLQQRQTRHGNRRDHTYCETGNGRIILLAEPIKMRGLPLVGQILTTVNQSSLFLRACQTTSYRMAKLNLVQG